jgi:hypothetical protein
MEDSFSTDKIGLAAYLMLRGCKLASVAVRNRNRSVFTFGIGPERAQELEQEYTLSDYSRYFEFFKHLRERTIRGS